MSIGGLPPLVLLVSIPIHHRGDGGGHKGGFKEFFRKTARRLKTLGSRRGLVDQIGELPYCAEAEARACLEGVHHLIDIQRFPGYVETDCQRVVQAVNSGMPDDRSPSWSIYVEIRDLLRNYPMLDVKKIDRGSNQVAHGLAQIGKRESSGVLNDSAPPFVAALIANDCKHLAL
jgi:hypothetical protein